MRGDGPWLPPYPYNHWRLDELIARDAEMRRIMRFALLPGRELPPEPEPSARDLRWRAEDAWLIRQWGLVNDLMSR